MPDSSPQAPEISIIVPCYNREQFIGEAIESALAQGPNVEVIVVDDGSTDSSPSIIASYGNVRPIRMANSGPSAARNAGIAHSSGRYLRFLDSDDRLPAGSTQALVQAASLLRENEIAFGDAVTIDEIGRPVTGMSYGYADLPPGTLPLRMMLDRPMQAWMPLYPVSAIRDAHGFNERLRIGEDHELAVRVASRGYRFFHLPAVTYEVRDHDCERLTRRYGAKGYRDLLTAFQTIWATLETREDALTAEERAAIGKMIWVLGRGAARERLRQESEHLFGLAEEVAGPDAFKATAGLRLAYRVMRPYTAERLLEACKAAVRRP